LLLEFFEFKTFFKTILKIKMCDLIHRANISKTSNTARIFSLIVFGFELDMLRLHMNTLQPVVHKFLVSESTLRFQTNSKKDAILSDNIHNFPKSIQEMTYIKIINTLQDCPLTITRFSSRCFQQIQRFETLNMFLSHSEFGNDMAIVSDTDEIARPNIVRYISECNIDAVIMKAHQYKFGLHCDSGNIWYEGPKIYSRRWIRQQKFTAKTFDNMRRRSTFSLPFIKNAAWHLTSFGTVDELHRKLTSFTAANLFHTNFSLNKNRLEKCTSKCFELLHNGKPSKCLINTELKVGKLLKNFPKNIPSDLYENHKSYPSSWYRNNKF